jgi:adenylate cyclase
MQTLKQTLLAVVALWLFGVLMAFVFAWNALDESFDLWALFHLRGPRPAPTEVIVVGLDQAAITQAGAAISAPREWPRAKHAQLIDRLRQGGARVIAFDLEFHKWRGDADDLQLARSVAEAGNVVLVAGLEQEVTAAAAVQGQDPVRTVAERLRSLPPALRAGAAAVVPFTLPRRPPRVNGYETFRAAAGDLPALPVAAFYQFTRDEHLFVMKLAAQVDPRAADAAAQALGRTNEQELSMMALRRMLAGNSALTERVRALLEQTPGVDAQRAQVLGSILDVYGSDAFRYLRFFGPPGTVRVISYEQALAATDIDWRGKAVFVGWLREQEKDIYYTPFSSAEGDDLPGVEIGATAFANLLQDKPLRPVQTGRQLLLLFAGALLLAALAMNLRALWVAPAVALLVLVYVWLALRQFDAQGVWLPLLVPLAVQAPLAVGLAWWRRTRELHRVADALSRVMENRLPREVAQRMARVLSPNLSGQTPEQWLMYGTCLHTDVSGYTRMAHALSPEELFRVMQNYFRDLEQIVTAHGGFVVDRAGDSMLALWASATPDRSQRAAACQAALAMQRATAMTAGAERPPSLPTRIGLDSGQISLGFIGSDGHREFRAFGDIVNTSQRVEEKNKALHTWVLATLNVVDGVDDVLLRPVGNFQLRGREAETEVVELMSALSSAAPEQAQLAAAFARALESYVGGRKSEAQERFTQLLGSAPQDGPTLYYLEQLWESGNSSHRV